MVRIIETPRDAFQSIARFVPTKRKIEYIQSLLQAGFDTVEVGSFVSPKAIPQMRDTSEVIKSLDLSHSSSRIMALVANLKGAQMAAEFEEIHDLSYPFSASPVFLGKNIGKDQHDSLQEIEQCLSICENRHKKLIVYITMAFGNPYGDAWNVETIVQWAEILYQLGVECIPLSDITGEADEMRITEVFTALISRFPEVEFGLHLHSDIDSAIPKVAAAYHAGCRRFDSVLGGLGGCPMTGQEMLSNLDTQTLLYYLKSQSEDPGITLPPAFQMDI